MAHALKPVLMTMGEPAGIGPEVTLKAWMARAQHNLAPFVYLGCLEHLRATNSSLGLDVDMTAVAAPQDAGKLPANTLPVIDLPLGMHVAPGKPDLAVAKSVIAAIEMGVELVAKNLASALVTNPINKKVLQSAGFAHPGHTEFLAELSNVSPTPRPVMMLCAPGLKAVPVTIHIPLHAVTENLTEDLIVETAQIVADDLQRYFAIAQPRLAIAGLNPHAGEGGVFGTQEADIITPAIATLKARGINAFGPLPADTMFHERARANYDAALCMYHDQALIPVKTLAFEQAVNVTLGLPFVRTSPDHGTAFDIAGKGIADPTSLIAALELARTMASNAAKPKASTS